MKKLFILILFGLYLAGCDDDNNEPLEFSIVSSDVNIPAGGGEGTIKVSAFNGFSAVSDEEWCTVAVSADVVTVSVPSNGELVNRTAMITIISGDKELKVPVTQAGVVFSVETDKLIVPRIGGSGQLKVTTNLNFNVSVEEEWVTYSVDDGVLTFTAEPNAETGARHTFAAINSGNFNAQVEIIQISYGDLLGDWNLSYLDDEGNPSTAIISLTEDVEGSSYTMAGLPAGLTLKLLYDNGKLIIENGQFLGMYSVYFLYLCAWNGSTLTWSSSVQYEAAVSLDSGWSYSFADNGTWTETVNGFLIAAFSADPPSSAGYAGYLLAMDQWVLTK